MIELFEIRDLGVHLGEFFLTDINLSLLKGEYLVVLGKSGTGKTVLLETIAGRYKVDTGTILKDNRLITDALPEERDIGFVYQNYELFSHMRVKDNIAFSLKFKKMKKSEIREKTSEMLDLLEITHLRDRFPRELSGGERQRVAIGRGIIRNPSLLLLDEPFSALDFITKESIKVVLKDLKRQFNPTVIHVTHDLREAMYFADKIGVIKDNTVKRVFTRKEIEGLESAEELYKYI